MGPIVIATYFLLLNTLASGNIVVGQFSAASLQSWQNKVFAGETQYTLTVDEGMQVLRAESNASASGLYREIEVDLTQTPYLNWSWKVDNVLQNIDERTKAGDDFPARVYLVVSGGALFWQTQSLVYVWSSQHPVGSRWNNPFTDNARHIAVRSGTDQSGQWLQEKRNVKKDFEALFGTSIDRIDAVAIMTDTDNSGQAAVAWYGDIYFSSE